uniref:Uncharacterized protein n=1 Tax=Lepeophtheirus salmonis TaxID=72036 RepID=A0A0K2T9E6_LEPSM
MPHLRRPYCQNEIIGTAALMFHLILYWVHKQHNFFGRMLCLFILVVVILKKVPNFSFLLTFWNAVRLALPNKKMNSF